MEEDFSRFMLAKMPGMIIPLCEVESCDDCIQSMFVYSIDIESNF